MKIKMFGLILFLAISLSVRAQAPKTATLTVASSGCQAANSCLVVSVPSGNGAATFTVSANSGTVAFDASGDGSLWVPLNATPSNSTTAGSSSTGTGVWQANVAAYQAVRIRLSASGSATVAISLSNASARSNGGNGGGGSGGGSGMVIDVTAAPYNVVPDGITDNSTALAAAFTAANAVTVGAVTVHFPCKTNAAPVCQYNYTDGGTTSPLAMSNLNGETIWCDAGVILRDTGTAHMIDVGSNGGLFYEPMNIRGCKFTGSSVTFGVYLNGGGFIESGHIEYNEFFNLPATSVAIGGTGSIYNLMYDYNYFWVNNGVAGEFLDIGNADNNQITAHHNLIACAGGGPPPTVTGCTSSKAGIIVGGIGSMVSDNFVASMNPDIQVASHGLRSHISGNNLEDAPYASHPAIQYGLSGDSANTVIANVTVDRNYMKSNSGAAMIGPVTANDLLVNWTMESNNSNGGNVLTSPNATLGQTGNISNANYCGSAPCLPILLTHGAVTPEPFLVESNFNVSDSFHRANGGLGFPWIAPASGTLSSITGNVATCGATCLNLNSMALPDNQIVSVQIDTAPTGTDSVGVTARYEQVDSVPNTSDYECVYTAGTGVLMYKIVANSATQLGATYTTQTPIAGDWLRQKSFGPIQTCVLNHGGTDIDAVTTVDSDVQHGYGGFLIVGSSGTIAAFTGQGLP